MIIGMVWVQYLLKCLVHKINVFYPHTLCLQLLAQNVSEGESRHWILIFNSAACIKKLISNIQGPWEAQFETPFPIHYD